MKCNKCGATLLMEQIPEVHISEASVDCNLPGCDGKATYRNNSTKQVITNGVSGVAQNTAHAPNILMEDNKDG